MTQTIAATNRPRRLDALTSVRFFFAMFVVTNHFFSRFPAATRGFPAFMQSMAPMAVGWFFVLSGFIIAHNYPVLRSKRDRCEFLILRIARLWPVHAAILTFGIAVGTFYPNDVWLLFHYTMTQSWSLSGDIAGGYNGPAWSISDELFFYCTYVAIAAPWPRLGLAVALLFIGAGIAVPTVDGCFVSFAAAGSASCTYFLYMFPPARLIEFIAGVAICRCRVRVPQLLGLAIAAAVFVGIGSVPPIVPAVNVALWEALVILGGGSLIAALAGDGWLSRLLSLPALVVGGEISYSIYMTHQMLIDVVVPWTHGLPLGLIFAAVVLATLLASAVLFYALEAPARGLVKRQLRAARGRRAESVPLRGIAVRPASEGGP